MPHTACGGSRWDATLRLPKDDAEGSSLSINTYKTYTDGENRVKAFAPEDPYFGRIRLFVH